MAIPTAGFMRVLEEDDSREVIKSLGSGHQLFDTASVYSYGASKEIVGRALNDFAPRDEIVVATKLYSKMKQRPNSGGLSRKAIFIKSNKA